MSQLARIYNKIIVIIYKIQAICKKFIHLLVSNLQVTKAHNYLYNYISDKRFNSHLLQYFNILSFIISILEQRKPITKSRLVETSETIRLILILFFFIFTNQFYYRLITSKFLNYKVKPGTNSLTSPSFSEGHLQPPSGGRSIKEYILLMNILIIKFNIRCLLLACWRSQENVKANYKFKPYSNIINKLNKKSFSTKTSINQYLLDDRIFNE
jgi:hypothetical protein